MNIRNLKDKSWRQQNRSLLRNAASPTKFDETENNIVLKVMENNDSKLKTKYSRVRFYEEVFRNKQANFLN